MNALGREREREREREKEREREREWWGFDEENVVSLCFMVYESL